LNDVPMIVHYLNLLPGLLQVRICYTQGMSKSNPALDLATAIVRQLQQAGHAAYFAGGCVRDRLMGRTPADYDVATAARPEQVAALFPRSQKVGAAFGVILVRDRQAQVEVATFRTDGRYSDGRHPDAVTFATAQEDAQRRDFTCNGLFYDPVADELHDFVAGQADIAARILRAIGVPAQRLAEDHLRMLRAVRFAAKLEFQIQDQTLAAIQTHAPQIRTVSRERVGEELRLILKHPARARGAALLEATGLLACIWPAALNPQPPAAWPALAALPVHITTALGLAALQLDLLATAATTTAVWPGCAAALRQGLMLSNQETADVEWLGQNLVVLREWPRLSQAQLKRLLADPRWAQLATLAGAAGVPQREALEQRVAELQRSGIAPPPWVTGNDLMALGGRPGKHFKQWLDTLYDLQLEGLLHTRDEALTRARELVEKQAQAPR